MRDMPKLESPFEREETEGGRFVCVPKIKEEFRWVFTENSIAVDKLDGTNVSIIIANNEIKELYNRMNPVKIFSKTGIRFAEGILAAIEKDYIKLEETKDGQYFGELIGEKVNANPYKITGHLWIPFGFLAEKYYYKFWPEFVLTLKELNDDDIFDKVSNLFKSLWSIYKRAKAIKGEVDENTVFENSAAAEGIVFYNKQAGCDSSSINPKMVCKLRRDMFSWYKGKSHETELA